MIFGFTILGFLAGMFFSFVADFGKIFKTSLNFTIFLVVALAVAFAAIAKDVLR